MKTGGHQLSYGTGIDPEKISALIEEVRQLGCGAFEVFLSGEFGPASAVREAAEKAGLAVIGLGIIRNELDGDPLSTEEKARLEAQARISQHISLTRRIGSSLLVGPLANVLAKPDAHYPNEAEIDAGVQTFRHVAKAASLENVRVAIEALQWLEMPWPNTVSDVLSFISRVEEPDDVPKGTLGVLFDIYHALRMEENWQTTLEKLLLTGKLFHVHVAGPDRTPPRMDQHIDWKTMISILKGAGWNGTVTIESFGEECDLPFEVVGPGKRLPAKEVISIGVETLRKAGL